jgi:hypothetical protein
MSSPDHIYYDISVYNNAQLGSSKPVPLIFTELKNQPFLDTPMNYELSIIKFHLDTGTLPIFCPEIQIGQPDPNLTTYSITMVANLSGGQQTFQFYIPFESPNPNIPVAPPTVSQDIQSEYYWVYTYQQWINNVNNALAMCLSTMSASWDTSAQTPDPPFFIYDTVSATVQLVADKASFTSSSQGTPPFLQLYFNSPLMKLFKSLPAQLNQRGATSGKDWQIVFFTNINNSNLSTLPKLSGTGTYTGVIMQQEVSSIGLLNPISSIVFTSSMLPVHGTLVGIPNSSSLLSSIGNNSDFASIITDFTVPVSATDGYNPTIDYVPSGEYRMIDLRGTNPLYGIDVRVFWRTTNNALIPFSLNANCHAYIKLMFRKKGVAGNSFFD